MDRVIISYAQLEHSPIRATISHAPHDVIPVCTKNCFVSPQVDMLPENALSLHRRQRLELENINCKHKINICFLLLKITDFIL
jgi:hypothetical protein